MSMVNRVDKTEQQEQKRNFDRKKNCKVSGGKVGLGTFHLDIVYFELICKQMYCVCIYMYVWVYIAI